MNLKTLPSPALMIQGWALIQDGSIASLVWGPWKNVQATLVISILQGKSTMLGTLKPVLNY
jgi:hypothetical protein